MGRMIPRLGPALATAPPRPDRLWLPSDRLVLFRPVEVADERLYPAFDASLTAEDRRLRFFSPSHLSAQQIARFTRFDRDQAAAILAVEAEGGAIAGVARLHRLEAGSGEFAVLVRSDLKRQGLGAALLGRILDEAGRLSIGTVVGLILRENTGMRHLASELGFALADHPDDRELIVARLAA